MRVLEVGLEPVQGQDLLVHARREELERIASPLLRLIHRDVGVIEQRHRVRAVDGAHRDPDARSDGDLPAADVERLLERGADAARHRLDLERTFDVLEQDGELVAAEPSDQVAFANAAREPLHDGPQQHVAGLVAERLVHDLEPVEIEQQQRHRSVPAQRARRRMAELVAQILPVGNTRQRIVAREVVEPDLRTLALDGVANRAQDRAPVALPLHEIVLDAAVQDLDGVILVALAAEHDDRHERTGFLDLLHALGAAAVGEVEIEQDDVELARCRAHVTASLIRLVRVT